MSELDESKSLWPEYLSLVYHISTTCILPALAMPGSVIMSTPRFVLSSNNFFSGIAQPSRELFEVLNQSSPPESVSSLLRIIQTHHLSGWGSAVDPRRRASCL